MRSQIALVCVIAALTASSAWPQSTPYEEAILLPITLAKPIPGAFGSLWATDLRVHASGGDIIFREFGPACGACLPTVRVASGTTQTLPLVGRIVGQPLGTLVFVRRETAKNAVFNLRIQDLSRQALTWGTELPVVRERDFRTEPLTLINIPTDARFRQALRIYDLNVDVGMPPTYFTVTIHDMQSGDVLAERDYRAVPAPEGPGRIPSWVEVTDLVAAFPQLASAERIRITIAPVNTGTVFWAFVSVTNNETQHVTTVTP
jgi:hypothetical protein